MVSRPMPLDLGMMQKGIISERQKREAACHLKPIEI